MKEYLLSYRLSPRLQDPERDLLVAAVSLREAVELAHRKLSLRYPHYQLVDALPLGDVRVEIEARR